MSSLISTTAGWYDRFVSFASHFDGVASLLLRLILAPVMIAAGWEKLTGENWFAFSMESFPFPFNVIPADLSWFLASYTEFFGGILLLLGLGTRIIAVPLAVTMFVAPGPIEVVQARVDSLFFNLAYPAAECTMACSLRV